LNEVQTSAYRPGEWNRLKIRVEAGKILGYVNDVLAVESTDTQYQQGQAGLASFRGTHAEFKGFEVGKDVPSVLPSRELTERVKRLAGHLKLDAPPDPKVVASFLSDADAGVRALRQEADRREREAKQLRRLAEVLQLTRVERELSSLFAKKDEKPIDLLRAALLVARIDNDDLDVDAYVREVDRLAAAVRAVLPPRANAAARLKALDEHLFKKLGFHGSRTDFYNRSNSFLNEVIDDREGIPITLAVLYIELARRLEVNVVGIGLPGRFLVRAEADQDDVPLIDVFDGARRLSRAEVETQVTAYTGRPSTPDDWRVQTKKQIVQRLVQNLVNTAEETNDAEGMLRYIDVLLTLDPASLADHWRRALLCYQTGRQSEALIEVNRLLGQDPGKLPATADPSQIRQLKKLLETHP
jgi:serine protease Do